MARTRLLELGFDIPGTLIASPESRLYVLLASRHGAGAHSKYNAWRRRLASFIRTAPCAAYRAIPKA